MKRLLNAAEKAFKVLHKSGKYKVSDLKNTKEYTTFIDETTSVFLDGINEGVQDNEITETLLEALSNDVFLFSALKTHSQLLEASRLLKDENGKIKPFSQFRKDIESIHSGYNQNYLESEYEFAVSSSQMAAQWAEIDGDRYNLQYRTAGDDRVRKSHESLHNTTLPVSDPFWNKYYPPNGWRCRCIAVEVLKGKYKESDSKKAIEKGDKATTEIGKNGANRLAIFRFNPGKQKVVFPPKHPYNKVAGSKTVKRDFKK